MTSCSLILLREALETPRRVLGKDEPPGAGHASGTPFSGYLPAVLAWLWYGSYEILGLCARNFLRPVDDNDNEDWTTVGTLSVVDGKASQEPGLNMLRWQFWKRQLQDIEQNSGDKDFAEQGKKCAHIMQSWESVTGGRDHDRGAARDAFFNGRV